MNGDPEVTAAYVSGTGSETAAMRFADTTTLTSGGQQQ